MCSRTTSAPPPALSALFIAVVYDLIGGHDPSRDRPLDLIELVRQEVAPAMRRLGLHGGVARDFNEPITDWGQVEYLAERGAPAIMDAISDAPCECVSTFAACLGVAAIAAWRKVAYAARGLRARSRRLATGHRPRRADRPPVPLDLQRHGRTRLRRPALTRCAGRTAAPGRHPPRSRERTLSR